MFSQSVSTAMNPDILSIASLIGHFTTQNAAEWKK
jgi:hypothetical protein